MHIVATVLFALAGIVGLTPALALLTFWYRFPSWLARIMHHAEHFWRSGRRSRAGDPSVWIGVRPLAVQHVWD
jgi:hypothetical protein